MPDSAEMSSLVLSMIERIANAQERIAEVVNMWCRMQAPPKPPGRKAMLPPKEVGQILQVSIERLAAWRSQGIGPAYHHVGKSVVYDPVDVEKFLVAHKVMTKVG